MSSRECADKFCPGYWPEAQVSLKIGWKGKSTPLAKCQLKAIPTLVKFDCQGHSGIFYDDAMDCCFAPPATLSCVLSGCGATDVLVQIDLNGLHDAVVADGHTASNAPDLF